MTVYMVLERLAEARLALEDTFPVSEKAWRMGGSKMFVSVNTRVSGGRPVARDHRPIGQRCVFVVARGAGRQRGSLRRRDDGTGTRDRPPRQHLQERERLAGAGSRHERARYRHPVGADHRGLPEHYTMFSEKSFTYNDIRQGNRNPLLYKELGADGLKTGHTEAAGYSLGRVRGTQRAPAGPSRHRARRRKRPCPPKPNACSTGDFASSPTTPCSRPARR